MRTRDWAAIDFYSVLGVEPTADADEIATAFRVLAKRLHPDRPLAGADDAVDFTTVVAAYEVLGDARLRRDYDRVRIESAPRRPSSSTMSPGTGATFRGPTSERRLRAVETDPRRALRNARRWLTAGVGVFLSGVLVATVVVRMQAHDAARRAGRRKTGAVVVPSRGHNDVRFTTAGGAVVEVPEPDRVNPGSDRSGTRLTVLYRPDDPRDVVIDESFAARDITLWIVAVKLLVGGIVFLGVGLRGRRRAARAGRPART